MKFYLLTAFTAILFSSCLKQSIPDAILAKKAGGLTTATLSYEINDNPVKISVNDADNQNPNAYTLGCSKSAGYYVLSGISDFGETTFIFYTDSLKTGNYKYSGAYGDMFFISYNNTNKYAHAPTDSMSFNITSYNNGHISGNFSGQLTPLITPSTFNDIFGDPGSVLITKGSFQNVPIFY